MQLTAAAVTLPAEHAARRSAGEAGAVAADAGVMLRGIVADSLERGGIPCFLSKVFA